MIFEPYIMKNENPIPVDIAEMRGTDAQKTKGMPEWQTDWTSEYITEADYEKYAVRTEQDELIALGMYEILDRALVVRIVYMEAQPESNPTISREVRKYKGIGRLMIAFGIKLSIMDLVEM